MSPFPGVVCALFALSACNTPAPPEVVGIEGQRCLVDDISFSELSAVLTADAAEPGSSHLQLSGKMSCKADAMAYADVYLFWETQPSLTYTQTSQDGTFSMTRSVATVNLKGTRAGVGAKGERSDPMVPPEWTHFPVTTP